MHCAVARECFTSLIEATPHLVLMQAQGCRVLVDCVILQLHMASIPGYVLSASHHRKRTALPPIPLTQTQLLYMVLHAKYAHATR